MVGGDCITAARACRVGSKEIEWFADRVSWFREIFRIEFSALLTPRPTEHDRYPIRDDVEKAADDESDEASYDEMRARKCREDIHLDLSAYLSARARVFSPGSGRDSSFFRPPGPS